MADNGPSYEGQSSQFLFRVVSSIALGLGVISGGYTVSTTDDRIRRAEVEAALRVRDAHLQHLETQYRELKEQVDRIDRSGPAVGNAGFERRISRLEERVK